MVILQEQNLRGLDRKSSKGNQLKFERSGIWYKADYMGYEGLAEYTVSRLLRYSTLKEHNIAVMTNDRREYRLCPVFDNGACLLSDTTMDYPVGPDCLTLIKRARPNTFCQDFSEQLDIVESLYGEQIHFSYGYHEV